MNLLHPRRWSLGFIAMRWRHVFWSLPLLGLVVGLVVHFLPMIRNTATGVVQIRPILSSASGLPLFSLSDTASTVESDKVLQATALALDLPGRWGLGGEECVAELRNAIYYDGIAGTSLVEISVSSRSRKESELIWDTLVTALNDHFKSLRSLEDQAKLDRLTAEVARMEEEVDSKRQALSRMIRTYDLLHRPNADPFAETSDFSKVKLEFEKAQAELEAAKLKLISEQMQWRLTEDPLIIHEGPTKPAPANLWEALRPLVVHATIGLGVGVLLSPVLAYLLELLFPRKTADEIPTPFDETTASGPVQRRF